MAKVLIFELDTDGTIVFANQAFEPLTGYLSEEVLNQNWWDLFFPEGRQDQVEGLHTRLLDNEQDHLEMTIQGADGSPIALHVCTAIRSRPDGRRTILGYASQAVISPEQEVASQYCHILDAMEEAIHMVDADLRIELFNASFQRWNEELGLQTEVIGRPLFEIFPFLPDEVGEEYRQVFANGETLITEESSEVAGRQILTETRKIPIFEGERVARVVTLIRDITQRGQADQALRRERDLVARIMETSPVGITVVSGEGQVTFANSHAEQVLGLAKDEITQRTYNAPEWRITDYEGNLFPDEQLPFRQVMSNGQPVWDVRHAIEWPDGRRTLLSINAAPLFDKSGHVDGMVATVEDVTERVRAEQQILARTQDLALINSLNDALNRGESLEAIYRLLAEKTKDTFASRGVSVFLLSEDGQHLIMQNVVLPPGMLRQIEKLIGMSIPHVEIPIEAAGAYRQAIRQKKAQLINKPEAIQELIAASIEGVRLPTPAYKQLRKLIPLIHKTVGINAVICTPLVLDVNVIGLLSISRQEPYSEEDLARLETIAGQLTAAIQRKRAEEALHHSEERYRNIVEASPMGMHMYTLEQDGRLVFTGANPAADTILGIDNQQFVGKTIEEAFPPLSETEVPERYRHACALGESWQTEQIDYADEQIRGAYAVYAFQTSPGNMAAMFLDITERKRAEQALRDSEERYRSLFEGVPVGVFRSTPDGYFLDANPTLMQMLGCANLEKLKATPVMEFYADPEQREQWQKLTEQAEGSRGWEVQWRRLDGSLIWASESARTVRDAEGKVLYYEGIAEDITERKRAEEALKGRLQELSALHSIAMVSAEALDSYDFLQHVAQTIGETMLPDNTEILLIDEDASTLNLTATYQVIDLQEDIRALPLGKGITGVVAQTGKTLRVGEVSQVPYYVSSDPRIRSELCVPLRVRERVTGVINIESTQPEAFSETDEQLLTTIASQLAIALHRVALHEELQVRIEQLRQRSEALARLYRASGALLSTTSLDTKSISQSIVDIVVSELGQSNCSLFLLSESQELERIAMAGPYTKEIKTFIKNLDSPGVIPRAIRTREIINLPDVSADPDYVPGWPAARSEIAIPLAIGKRALGVIDVQSAEPAAFDSEVESLMSIFAEQAALALINARLHEHTQKRAQEFMALYETTLALAGEQDLTSLLGMIIERAAGLLKVPNGGIYLYDAAHDELEMSLANNPLIPAGARLKIGEGMAGVVAQTRQPMIIEDYHAWEGRSHQYDEVPFSSVLEVPMLYAGDLIGVLVIYEVSPARRNFAEADVHLLSLFAAQAAAAVRSARLFEETRQRLAEIETVSRVSSTLRVAETLDEMLPILLDETLAVIGTEAGAISLYNPATNELTPAVTRGWFVETGGPAIKPGEGIVGHVFSTGEIHQSNDFSSDPLTYAPSKKHTPAGWGGVCVPIRTARTTVGALIVSLESPRQITSQETNLLSTLAEIAGNAIHRMRLHEQTELRLQRITTLRAIDQAISASVDLRLTLGILLEHATSQLEVDAADILLLRPGTHMLEYATGHGFRSPIAQPVPLRLGEGYAGRVALERSTVYIPNLTESRGGFKHPRSLVNEGFVAYVGIPLIAKGMVKGVLEVFHRAPLDPDPEWQDFLESLAGQAAIAIDSAWLFEKLQQTNLELSLAYDATIEGWANALELRDRESRGHTQRVTELTVHLTRAMGLSENEIVHVRRGALLHDIGKMGIPDYILQKPGPLTHEEWQIMKQHPSHAYNLLSPIAFLKPALDIPYYHHERWDGSGYPNGLRGEQIPLAARIFAVVEHWDVLLSDRPYREAWSPTRVREYLREKTGTHFDPHVVETFLNTVDEI